MAPGSFEKEDVTCETVVARERGWRGEQEVPQRAFDEANGGE